MSLPAGQVRALNGIEGALKASEPQLASMFAIFARLNRDEPVRAELLQRDRLRWLRPGTAVSAIVLIPVMFAAIIIGALLGGNARGATTCGVGYPVGGGSALVHRASCLRAQAWAAAQPVSAAAGTGSAKSASGATSASGGGSSSCSTTVAAARFTTAGRRDQALSPAAREGTTTAGLSGMC